MTVLSKLLDRCEPQCPHLYTGHNSGLAVLLKELNKMNANHRTGWQSGAGGGRGWSPPIPRMGTSENGEGFYRWLGSWHAHSQARPPGSLHRRGTTEGPSARKRNKKQVHVRRSCQILLPVVFGANHEKKIWSSEQFVFHNFRFGIVVL